MNRISPILLLLLLSFYSLNACETDTLKQEISAVEVRSLTPMGDDFYRIYKAGDLIMCQSHYYHGANHNETTIKDTAVTGDITITSIADSTSFESRPYYFVYHKDSLYGYNFAPFNEINNNKRLLVDSLLKIRKLQTGNTSLFLQSKADSIIWNEDKTELKEVYITPPGPNCPTTIYASYHYSKNLMKMGESFSASIDSARNMKLYKMEYLMASYWSESHKMQVPQMKFYHEMLKVTVEDKAEIQAYFDRYQKITTRPKK